jgi:hypothetical protein
LHVDFHVSDLKRLLGGLSRLRPGHTKSRCSVNDLRQVFLLAGVVELADVIHDSFLSNVPPCQNRSFDLMGQGFSDSWFIPLRHGCSIGRVFILFPGFS